MVDDHSHTGDLIKMPIYFANKEPNKLFGMVERVASCR